MFTVAVVGPDRQPVPAGRGGEATNYRGNNFISAHDGSAGSLSAGGAGNSSRTNYSAGSGGNPGAAGQAGQATGGSSSNSAGGATGNAIDGHSYVTYTAAGTISGAQVN